MKKAIIEREEVTTPPIKTVTVEFTRREAEILKGLMGATRLSAQTGLEIDWTSCKASYPHIWEVEAHRFVVELFNAIPVEVTGV